MELVVAVTVAYLRHCQTSKTELSVKIINGLNSSTIFAKSSILEVLQGSEYASVSLAAISKTAFKFVQTCNSNYMLFEIILSKLSFESFETLEAREILKFKIAIEVNLSQI